MVQFPGQVDFSSEEPFDDTVVHGDAVDAVVFVVSPLFVVLTSYSVQSSASLPLNKLSSLAKTLSPKSKFA